MATDPPSCAASTADADAPPAAGALEWVARARLRRSPPALFFVLPFVFVVLTALMSDQQTLTRDLWPQTWRVAQPASTSGTRRASRTWWRNTLVYAVARHRR